MEVIQNSSPRRLIVRLSIRSPVVRRSPKCPWARVRCCKVCPFEDALRSEASLCQTSVQSMCAISIVGSQSRDLIQVGMLDISWRHRCCQVAGIKGVVDDHEISTDSVLYRTPSLGPLAKRIEDWARPALPDCSHGHIVWGHVELRCLGASSVFQRQIPCVGSALCGEEIFNAAAQMLVPAQKVAVCRWRTLTWNGRCSLRPLSRVARIPSRAAGRQAAGSRRHVIHSQLCLRRREAVLMFHCGPVQQGSCSQLLVCNTPVAELAAYLDIVLAPAHACQTGGHGTHRGRMRGWRVMDATAHIDDAWWLGAEETRAGCCGDD